MATQSDIEAQNVLAPALSDSLSDAEAANLYLQAVNAWYNQNNSSAFKAFKKHISRMVELVQSKEEKVVLDATRALGFAAASALVHRKMLDCRVLDVMVHILDSWGHAAAICEATLVVMNHLCNKNPDKQPKKFSRISDFCQQSESLLVIFRYAHVENSSRGLLINVFSLLAHLCNHRGIQLTEF